MINLQKMRHLSSGPIFTLTKNHKIFLKKSHYLSFYTQTQQNPSPGNHHHPRRKEEEDRRVVPVSVWWDFENCNLPLNSNVFRVGQCITNAVRANRINGPIKITAFGDVVQISRTNQEALSATGITLIHVPSGGKNSADRSLLVDLMYWVSENPPPAHLFLISGDRDFASVLHRLRMSNYNILLASPDSAPSVLCCAATIMWQWSSLLKGENLTGKLFNQPPDGLFNSWYGRYKAPLEDPYAVAEQSTCVDNNNNNNVSEQSVELVPEPKVRHIPKAVRKHICHILDSYPEGIAITNLRAELFNKGNLIADRDLYGYKKFSRFLLAMPSLLSLHSGNDGQFIVQRVGNKFLDDPDGEDGGSLVDVTEKTKLPLVLETKVKSLPTANLVEVRKEEKPKKEEKRKEITTLKRKTQEVQAEDRKVNGGNKDISEKNETPTSVVDAHRSDSESGITRRVWLKLFGSGDKGSIELGTPALFSPSSHERIIYGGNGGTSDDDVAADVPGQDAGFLDRVMGWFKFSSYREVDVGVEKNGEKTENAKINNPNWVEMFSRESFWKEMELFIGTQQGSAIFPRSLTRNHLAKNLQTQGPQSLKSLSKPELLHLVDLLISDKKWVEECISRAFPFRHTPPSAVYNNPPPDLNSSGLSQFFSFKQPTGPLESGERKHQNPPHTGVPQSVAQGNPSCKRTRSELLVDCQKLVDQIVKEHPEGFHIGSFRKLFLEKYGYALDLQKLGYEKLVNLLQIMPRVRIESNLIFPASSYKNPKPQTKYDNDSTWDELGPVDNFIHDYEPVLFGDFSDSEDEVSGNEANKPKPEEESSLLQILDTWYSNKDCDDGKKGGPPSVSVTDEAGVVSQPPAAHTAVESGTKSETSTASSNPLRKHKRGKSYTFVSEHVDSKDRLVEGIMDSMKKSGVIKANSFI